MSEIRKLQKDHRRGKSPEEQQLEREVSTLREHLTILSKVTNNYLYSDKVIIVSLFTGTLTARRENKQN